MLRLIAFNMDYYWACNRIGTTDKGADLNHKERNSTYHPLEMYNYMNYVAYILYPPLYLAGPIMTYNDFLWQNVLLNTLLVFTFVALWHDLSFKLLTWGWLISLFFLPEILARYLLPPRKYGDKWWYRHICAVGAVGNMLMLTAANLVGFAVGTEGVSYMLTRMFLDWDGIRFISVSCICLFVGAQLMFEYREEEMRKGIYRRC
ncbi:hypothetical protein EUX98_g722 [Antrodiella citrinella]|uniref:MBOAT family protein n=1 Tax=Antrodiella citrinella TaxID=2447956 RepID=A0A4S4NBW0_9APHY|nr:hypothetical protein EUX98_g722 [Antrodiella citrinella]